MLQYTLKRLLLAIPTFFLISLLLFGVLNIAPGRPGESGQAAQTGESASQIQRESYVLFRRQFHLDRPILFNTRFRLDAAEVRTLLEAAHDIGRDAPAAEQIDANERLEDGGRYLVRPLIELLVGDPDPELRRVAAERLTVAGKGELLDDRKPTEEIRAKNQEISAENERIKAWRWGRDDPPERAAEVTAAWQAWFAAREADFTFTLGEQVSILLFDTRFAKYWSNLLRLDFGVSNVDRRPVLPTLLSKLKYSVSLSLLSILLAYAIAVPIGIWSAVRSGTASDTGITISLFILYSLPSFFTGTVLLRLLSEGDPVGWFPTGGWASMDGLPRTTWEQIGDVAWHLVLPVATYTSTALASLSRYARAGIIEVIRADYIRTARAKGLSEPWVILKHAARNGMIPVLTLLGGLLPALVGGSVVIEVIFGIPGMGLYLFDAINLRDYNVVMAVLQASSVLALLGILLSDLSYALADPRISFD